MGFLEPTHWIIIAIVVFVFFGPKKIPELMRGIGKGMGELQKGIADSKRALTDAMDEVKREPEPEPAKAEPKTPDHAAGLETSAEISKAAEAPKEAKSESPAPVG